MPNYTVRVHFSDNDLERVDIIDSLMRSVRKLDALDSENEYSRELVDIACHLSRQILGSDPLVGHEELIQLMLSDCCGYERMLKNSAEATINSVLS